MDTTFFTDEGVFNYRVAGVMINDNKLLVMKDPPHPYYYLPGGRLQLHETAENAMIRELREELFIDSRIVRPLWLDQCFYTDESDHRKYHEVCVYFLVDVSNTHLLEKGDKFTLSEGDRTHVFEWMGFDRLKTERIYPVFLKDRIFRLPETLELLTTIE